MTNALWPEVAAAIAQAHTGQRATATRTLENCWEACTPEDHALRCIIAHYLADLQTDPATELMWDQRALDAHGKVADSDLQPFGLTSAEQMLPSLHLNLGDAWLRAGDPVRAAHHLRQGQSARPVLGDDAYGRMILNGLVALADRIDQRTGGPSRELRVEVGSSAEWPGFPLAWMGSAPVPR